MEKSWTAPSIESFTTPKDRPTRSTRPKGSSAEGVVIDAEDLQIEILAAGKAEQGITDCAADEVGGFEFAGPNGGAGPGFRGG